MQEAGTVLHLARSGRLILKAFSQVSDGTVLIDEEGRRTGRVIETIGPVASPYLSVQPMTDRIERVVGAKLFVSEAQRVENSGRKISKYRSKNVKPDRKEKHDRSQRRH